jgi:hypothetical protein
LLDILTGFETRKNGLTNYVAGMGGGTKVKDNVDPVLN